MIGAHDIILGLALVFSLGMAGAKFYRMRRRHDRLRWLQVCAALTGLYVAVVYALTIAGMLDYQPVRVNILGPALVVLLALEIAHAIVDW